MKKIQFGKINFEDIHFEKKDWENTLWKNILWEVVEVMLRSIYWKMKHFHLQIVDENFLSTIVDEHF